ncbi:hypothetical protein OE88DRAFT_1196802 [Heliocybe sulcata]|uniref:Uncharacterized protein n=1 Tax=Heliocybe sulcata TaxID=5364 RepID=A0A5C3NDC9_9AGAM|nr:hypothetical protein OE88DRAFT_1196802 [Heliocybe sulcata]
MEKAQYITADLRHAQRSYGGVLGSRQNPAPSRWNLTLAVIAGRKTTILAERADVDTPSGLCII